MVMEFYIHLTVPIMEEYLNHLPKILIVQILLALQTNAVLLFPGWLSLPQRPERAEIHMVKEWMIIRLTAPTGRLERRLNQLRLQRYLVLVIVLYLNAVICPKRA